MGKSMSKQVQVPESVLVDILRLSYCLEGYELDETTQSALNRLVVVVDGKIEAKNRRNIYTAYKTATPGTDEREKARQKYLDEMGIHKNWRTEKETPP